MKNERCPLGKLFEIEEQPLGDDFEDLVFVALEGLQPSAPSREEYPLNNVGDVF